MKEYLQVSGIILENCMKEAKYLDSVDSQEIHQMILKTAYDEFSGEK